VLEWHNLLAFCSVVGFLRNVSLQPNGMCFANEATFTDLLVKLPERLLTGF
jgi:hypothetical protein